MTASKNIQGRAMNKWCVAQREKNEKRLLTALKAGPMSRADMRNLCGMKETTVWRTVDALLLRGQIVDAEPRTGANRCQERMFRLCDPLTGPIPIQKRPKAVEKVSRDPFIAVLFGPCEAKAGSPIPSRVHRMADDEMKAA